MLIGKLLALGVIGLACLLVINYLANSIAVGTAIVVDGDTVQIGDKILTFEGLDAVELDQTCTFNGKQWPCGRQAAAVLSATIGDKTVTCRPTGEKKNDRQLARCFTGADFDLGQSQVKNGWALALSSEAVNYKPDEKAARASLVGIWSSFFDQPWHVAKTQKDVIP